MLKHRMREYLSFFWRRLSQGLSSERLTYTFLFLFVFTGAFAPFLASSQPLFIYDKAGYESKSGTALKRSPLLYTLFYNDTQVEKIEYRRLVEKGEIGAIFTLVPYSPYETELENYLKPPRFLGARFVHYLGTDENGRDVAARLIRGTRNSLLVSLVAVGLALAIGVFVGALAGYFGGWVDMVISRFIEIVICFPKLILIIAVMALKKPSLLNLMIVIGLTSWTGIARLVRGEVMRVRNFDYVQSARAMGASSWRIIFIHILPATAGPLSVTAAFDVAEAVLTESALSFLGIGVPIPEPSWGDVLKTAQDFPDIAWWMTLFPGLLIFLTVITFNNLGDKLRQKFAR
ncbi:MAG TPA: ABC transporter permease [Turneriella sp.]|nr:ABC transporter permease [Turneriella sp.]HNE20726.1 ABC transporter permease [Turneriella sp.]HNL10307.1 ABC transporter permease [Turneriella sp.]HNL52910.1 ABC transporter permease [Turneriella sp.]